MRLNLHARLEVALVATLFLTSCNESNRFVTQDEAVDIADDSIDASGVTDRLDRLESRIDDIEARLGT
jgi:hypothetical protein